MWSGPNEQTGMDLFLKYPRYRDPFLLNLIFKNVEYLSKYVSKVAHWDLSRKMNAMHDFGILGMWIERNLKETGKWE